MLLKPKLCFQAWSSLTYYPQAPPTLLTQCLLPVPAVTSYHHQTELLLIPLVSQHTGAAQPLCSIQLLGSSNPDPLGRLCQAATEVRKVNTPPLHRGTASLMLPPLPSKKDFQVCWLFDLGFVRVSGSNPTANRRRTWRGQHPTVPGLLRKKRPP